MIDTDLELCWLCGHLATTHHPATNTNIRYCAHRDCRCRRDITEPWTTQLWRRCEGTAQLLEMRPVLHDVECPDLEFLPGSTCWQLRTGSSITREIIVLGVVSNGLNVVHVMSADDTGTVVAQSDDDYSAIACDLLGSREPPDRWLLESSLGRMGFRALF